MIQDRSETPNKTHRQMATPLHEAFLPLAQAIAYVLRDAVETAKAIPRHCHFRSELHESDDGVPTLRYYRPDKVAIHSHIVPGILGPPHVSKDWATMVVEFSDIRPAKRGDIEYGAEQIVKQDVISSKEREYRNSTDIESDEEFSAEYTQEHSSESGQTEGVSVAVELKTSASVEGVGGFESSIRSEVHKEIESRESDASSETDSSSTSFTLPAQSCILVRIKRTITLKHIPADIVGDYGFTIKIGHHSGGKFVHHGYAHFNSWDDFVLTLKGHAPDNWSLGSHFHKHPLPQSSHYVFNARPSIPLTFTCVVETRRDELDRSNCEDE